MADVLKTSKARRALRALALTAILVSAFGCQSKAVKDEAESLGIVVVNAPAAGEVRRVLVREGVSVGVGDPVVEIVVRSEARSESARTEDPLARAGRNIGAAQGEVEAARAEVVRTEVEVGRLTPLVASGDAPQGQLDGARADYERAQQRFRQAQSAAQSAQSGLVAARQQQQTPNSSSAPAPSEQIVTARATSAGTVSAVSVRAGQNVTAGQPLATLRAGTR
ncbi:MAG: biotin/lipoyl-binding protein [Acidobacteria bacterium]|nr:biotin/lipoyl-binding protein [Acidobacteriota bacterium]